MELLSLQQCRSQGGGEEGAGGAEEGGAQEEEEEKEGEKKDETTELLPQVQEQIVEAYLLNFLLAHDFSAVLSSLFENLLEKIGVWVGNRVAMNEGVTPMDIGEVGWNDYNESEEHVDAVGAWSRCKRCDGWGHFARDCPSKGKGKSDFGKGGGKGNHNGNSNFKGGCKGEGKNNQYKGDGKGGKGQKGGGKGYQGTCWRCGTVGHKVHECTKQIPGG